MKKTVLAIIAFTLTLALSAQNAMDGLMFSRNNYEGSARSMAMGNAVTALGGDLGGITINPAGSAVAPYSQIAISPGVDISIRTTQGTSLNNLHPYFQKRMKNTHTRFNLPNLGFTINWNTYSKSGLKNFTFGFVCNQTQNFSDNTYAKGTNDKTSFMGSLAENAYLSYFKEGELGNEDSWFGQINRPIRGPLWDYVAAMQAQLIAPIDPDPNNDDPDQFIGATEQPIEGMGYNKVLGGTLEQHYGREIFGSKYDYTFNFGFNFNNSLWLGLNLNINSLDYNSMNYIREIARDGNFGFDYTDNQSGEHRHAEFYEGKLINNYRASGIGFSTKIGVIWSPIKAIRVGAAIQTPTWNKINEEWTTDAHSDYNFGHNKAESPLGKYSYKFREPMRVNAGISYIFGNRGLVSLDYEYTPYNMMKFNSYDAFDDILDGANQDIKDFTGAGHNLRIGTEIKIIPELAFRAGYSFMNTGEYGKNDNNRKVALKQFIHEVGFGLGFSSKGSFFADIACKASMYPDEYIIPYSDYRYKKDSISGKFVDIEGHVINEPWRADNWDKLVPEGFDPNKPERLSDFSTPEIQNIRNNWKVVLTIGFRF